MHTKLNTLSTTFLVVASMLGTGILTTTGSILSLVKSPGAVIAVWIAGGLLAWFGAYCYGTIVRALPRNGGEAVILKEYFSPVLGEITGWVSFIVGFAASNAATSLALAAYLDAAFPGLAWRSEIVACFALIVVTALHSVVGASGIRIQTALAACKFSLLAALALYGLLLASPDAISNAVPSDANTVAAFGSEWGVAMMLVMFAYSGWNAAIYVAAEVRNPGRTVRNAMVIGTSITLLLYVAVNIAVLRHLPAAEIEGVIPVISLLVKTMFGDAAAHWFSGLVAFALLSSLGASAFIGPRVLAATLEWIRGQNREATAASEAPRTSPVSPRLIWLQAAISMGMVLTGTFEQILTVMGFLLGLFPILCVFAIYRIVDVTEQRAPAIARYVFGPMFISVMSGILVLGALQKPAEVTVALLLVFSLFILRRGLRQIGGAR